MKHTCETTHFSKVVQLELAESYQPATLQIRSKCELNLMKTK